MSATVANKKQCVTCSKSGGIMICGGCEQSFCGKHSVEHRQELTHQLDEIMQEHDLLQQELAQSSVNNVLLKEIDTWEKESIVKIQTAAEAARVELRQVLDGSKKKILNTCRDIAVNLRASREADDFSESDLDQWMRQLKELKLELDSPSAIKLVKDERSPVPLIRLEHIGCTNKESIKSKPVSARKTSSLSLPQERFLHRLGNVRLEGEGTVARHIGSSRDYMNILGERLYSQGRQRVRLRMEFGQASYNIFLGCISSQAVNDKIHFCSLISAGWFGHNQIYHHGEINERSYDSSQIRTDDILAVTFDCDKQRIELHHERTNQTNHLQIDIRKAPLPWRLLVVLCRPRDCVRIMPND